MATTACTTNNQTAIVVGYVPASGDTVGEVVTFNTPHAVWTDTSEVNSIQCSSIAVGGFNGLNS